MAIARPAADRLAAAPARRFPRPRDIESRALATTDETPAAVIVEPLWTPGSASAGEPPGIGVVSLSWFAVKSMNDSRLRQFDLSAQSSSRRARSVDTLSVDAGFPRPPADNQIFRVDVRNAVGVPHRCEGAFAVMPDISSIGPGPIPPLERSATHDRPVAETNGLVRPPARPGDRQADSVELSDHARYLDKLRHLPDVREDRVAEIRTAIARGSYDVGRKLDVAIDRLLDDIVADQ
jgi:flagellar biosynthesis anti-sigma factor FlgM